MTIATDERRTHGTNVIAVRRGDREIGAYVVGPHTTTFVPAVDVSRVVMATLGAAVAMTATVAAAVAVRRRPAIGTVTMGPGGWVSLKKTGAPPLRDGSRRPWWAHALRAHRLVIDH